MIATEPLPWPYVLRRSLRARYLKIQLTLGKPIEVIYPRRANKRDALQFLHEKRYWIEQQTPYLDSLTNTTPNQLPEQFVFPSLNEAWQLEYQHPMTQKQTTVSQRPNRLIIKATDDTHHTSIQALKRWLKQHAQRHLEPQFIQLAHDSALTSQSLSWRCQKTRWGSCNQNGAINLNIKLLFLPAPLIRYVMLHELSHTKHMHHNRAFWHCLQQHLPDARALDHTLTRYPIHTLQWLHP
jgi:predicted metal-dependent hydrolase